MESQGDVYDAILSELQRARRILVESALPDGTIDMQKARMAMFVTDMAEYQLNDVGGRDGRVRRPASDN